MPKVSFRMASASCESVFGVRTSTARKSHRSDHIEGRFDHTRQADAAYGREPVADTRPRYGALSRRCRHRVSRKTRPVRCRSDGASTGTPAAPALKRERDDGQVWRAPWDKEDPCRPSFLRLA